MKIQSINLIKNIAPKQVNGWHSKPTFKSSSTGDVFAPSENEKPLQIDCGMSQQDTFAHSEDADFKGYSEFLNQCVKTFPNKTFAEVLSTVSLTDDLIGEGRESRVYRIKGIDDYVVKLSKSEYDYDPEWYNNRIKPCFDDYPNHNFGQVVATVGPSVKILKRVTGEANGVENWYAKFQHSTPRTRQDAEKILKDVARIAEFPQSAFDKIASDIIFLTSKKIKIDSINPNNLMIDYEKKEISLVDVEKKNYKNSKNTMYDLLVPLLDLTAFEEYKKIFSKEEMSQFLKSAKIIYKKIAKTKLPNDIESDKNFRKSTLLTPKGIDELDDVIKLIKKLKPQSSKLCYNLSQIFNKD